MVVPQELGAGKKRRIVGVYGKGKGKKYESLNLMALLQGELQRF